MKINKDTKLKEINNAPEFSQAKGHFISGSVDQLSGEDEDLTLEELQQKNPTWNHRDIIFGLERLQEVSGKSNQYVYQVYSDEKIEIDSHLGQVQLLYFPR